MGMVRFTELHRGQHPDLFTSTGALPGFSPVMLQDIQILIFLEFNHFQILCDILKFNHKCEW